MQDHTPQLPLFITAPHDPTLEIPYGYCQCGCGQLAPVATKTLTRLGHIKGQPVRFIIGHHNNVRVYPSPNERFWIHVNKCGPDDCWEWKSARSAKGYGQFHINRSSTIAAHRFSYTLRYGSFPRRA